MILPQNKNILFINPHCDDESISAGAPLTTLDKNNKVTVYFIANSPRGVNKKLSDEENVKIRQGEIMRSSEILGITTKSLNLDDIYKKDGYWIKLMLEQRFQSRMLRQFYG